MRHSYVSLACILACLPACTAALDDSTLEHEAAAEAAGALEVSATRKAFAFDVARRDDLIHGIAGDRQLIFLTEPLTGRVTAHDRFTGAHVADLPPPPGGFLLPFTLRSPSDGRLVVLDAGGFPSPTAPAIPKIYEYDYTRHHGTFQATLVRTIDFSGLPVVFSEDVEITDDGTYVVSDSVIGSLWLVETDGTIRPGLLPSSFAPDAGLPYLAPCFQPIPTIDGIPYDLGGGFAPGVGSLAYSQGYVYWGGFCHGGVHRVPLATLRDTTRTAEARAADIEVVSARAPGDVELIKGLAFNRFDPGDTRLYAADSLELRMIRIDVDTGAREVLTNNEDLFNFPVSAAFLPPVLGVTPLAVASDQEHRFDALNFAIDTDLTEPPFLAAKLYVRD
jgi:hypothetical protein